MASFINNTYVVNQLATVAGATVTDDGGGTDWLVLRGSYPQQTDIRLFGNSSTQATASFFISDSVSKSLTVNGVIENVRGSNGEDFIQGGKGANILYGDNTAFGPGAADVIWGLGGNDRIYGGAGRDDIAGDDGKDTLFGNAGGDKINGGGGVDLIEGGAGGDTLSGGASIGDAVSYASSSAGVIIRLTFGDTTTGQGGDARGDKINGFTDIYGSNFKDRLEDTVAGAVGTDFNKNRFFGGGGDDKLLLGGGNDTGKGGSGNDILVGGQGRDLLIGNSGKDMFVFTAITDSTVDSAGRDVITDLTRSQGDRVDLSAIDADTIGNGDQDFTFIGTNAFSGDAGEIRIKAAGNGFLVIGNVDDDKGADFAIFVDDVVSLKAIDFIL